MEHGRDIDTNNNMAEKIIHQLSTNLKDLNAIEDFSIILSTTNAFDRNVSPVHYVESERCLGLESWCVKQVFSYCQVQILQLHRQIASRPSTEDVSKLNLYLNIALLLQAEVNTFWNYKREFYAYLNAHQEMLFAKLVLSHSPKSLQTYSYRMWLIRRCNDWDYVELLKGEFIIINKAVLQRANNYHAWNHRIWCIEYLASKTSNSNIILDEYEYSVRFVNQHVSEHSSFHYRQFILEKFKFFDWNQMKLEFNNNVISKLGNYGKCLTNGLDYLSLMLYELVEVCRQLLVFYPGHESVWYHRRFVMNQVITEIKNVICTNPLLQESQLYNNLLWYEVNFLNLVMNCNNLLVIDYCRKHRKWLMSMLSFDLSEEVVLDHGDVLFPIE